MTITSSQYFAVRTIPAHMTFESVAVASNALVRTATH